MAEEIDDLQRELRRQRREAESQAQVDGASSQRLPKIVRPIRRLIGEACRAGTRASSTVPYSLALRSCTGFDLEGQRDAPGRCMPCRVIRQAAGVTPSHRLWGYGNTIMKK